jgi:hypothetical protein
VVLGLYPTQKDFQHKNPWNLFLKTLAQKCEMHSAYPSPHRRHFDQTFVQNPIILLGKNAEKQKKKKIKRIFLSHQLSIHGPSRIAKNISRCLNFFLSYFVDSQTYG